MSWYHGLLGIQPFDSEHYERKVCTRCRGTGSPRNSYTVLYPTQRFWGVRCSQCHGKGYVVVKKGT
jgi:DnaJ-class molecular chaperone